MKSHPEGWSAEEEAEYHRLLERQHATEPLDEFIYRINPNLPSPDHVKPIRDAFEESRQRPVNVLLSFPPRHAKTYTIQAGVARSTCIDPALTHAYITYGQSQAERKSKGIQRMAKDGGASLDSESVRYWTTHAGGGLLATSIGGEYTGMGTTGIQVIDDPYKDAKQAESAAWCNEVNDWFDGVARHRLEPGGSRIIVHTRWTQNDLIGRMLREEARRYRYINLPAVSGFVESAAEAALHAVKTGKRPDYEAIGKALWPEYQPMSELLDKMVSKYFWWSQFMGDPRLRGQQLFDEPARFDHRTFDLRGKRAAIVVDPATTKKTKADHSVIGIYAMEGYGIESVMYVLDVIRAQVTTPELVRMIRDVQRKWGFMVVIESVGGFKGVPQTILDLEPSLKGRIYEIQPDQDKFLRAQPAAGAWNLGRVLIPTLAPWASDYIVEHGRFTGVNDAEDDQVDCTAHAWNTLYREFDPGLRRRQARNRGPFG